jgi:chromosomal replication initiation ATPase DnaA
MKELNQQIIKFNHDSSFKDEDFYVSKSNKHIIDFLNKWPKWEKNFLNISGEKNSGKTHLVNIFLKRFKGIKFEAKLFNNENLKEVKIHQNIILENLNNEINENLIYTLFNIVDQDNKYLIVTSNKNISSIQFNLSDLISRSKNFLLQNIEKPDDELIYALLVKNFSDRQISLEKKLINYIIKRIDRSYSKIFEFIYKIDEISLKKKKSIDLKIVKEVLEKN